MICGCYCPTRSSVGDRRPSDVEPTDGSAILAEQTQKSPMISADILSQYDNKH
jgi:hypothetical protein